MTSAKLEAEENIRIGVPFASTLHRNSKAWLDYLIVYLLR